MNIREPERHISYYDDALVCFDVEINKNEQKRENYNKRNKKKTHVVDHARSFKQKVDAFNVFIKLYNYGHYKNERFILFFICIEFLLPKEQLPIHTKWNILNFIAFA